MNNENFREQPILDDDVQMAEAKNDDGISSSQENGSQLGKFKDAETLLSAYNNLQAEFTKKCQKLSELERQNVDASNSTPIYMSEQWTDKVSQFLQKNQDAKNYASEISDFILNNPEIQKSENPLELAWGKIVQQKYVAPEKIIEDESYIEKYIINNSSIKQKILNQYLNEIQKNSSPPLISSKDGGNIAFLSQKQPTSLLEAKKMVEQLFNAKGE